MVVIEIDGIEATIEGMEWECDDEFLQERLKLWTELKISMGQFSMDSPFFALNSPSNPWPDMIIATEAANAFNGIIINSEPPEFDDDENIIY